MECRVSSLKSRGSAPPGSYASEVSLSNTFIIIIILYSNLDALYRFVDSITTPSGVGGDGAEDVFGGLHKALKLAWPKEGTKVNNNIMQFKKGTTYSLLHWA